MAVVNEVITKFSFVGSLKPQENFNANLKASIGLLGGLVTGIQAATAGFVYWTTSVTEAIDPMVQLSRETKVSIAAIQELGFAASQNGSNLDSVQSSIRELTKRVGEFARTGGGPAAEAILQLGLRVRDANGHMKSADRIMSDLRGRFQDFNAAEQADILDKLGIDPSLIQLLNQSGDAIDSLREKARALGTITKEQGNAAAALNDANTTLRFGLTSLQNQIAVGVAPVIKDITEGFIEFLIANKDLIRDGIRRLGDVLLSLSGFITRMTPIVAGVTAAFVAWKVATVGLGKALAIAFSPVTLITGAIIAAALAVDDLIVAFNGGQSVIRDFILEWTGFDITPALQNAVAAVGAFVDKAISMFSVLKDFVADIFSGISDSISGIFNTVGNAASSVGDFFGITGGADGAVNNGITNTSTSNASIEQNITNNIYTSDPVLAGNTASSASNQSLRETREYFERGGL